MNTWRRKGNQEFSRTKYNHYRNPPVGGSSNWQQTIPSWEKRFCTSVGSVPWKRFLEAKRYTYLYDNIMNWDDSAAKEAFLNAKNRFYAKIHDLPCDIRLPESYLYIDEIDWNAKVDDNLILDLESDYVPPAPDRNDEPVIIFGDTIPDPYQHYTPYGWGDSENVKKVDENGINWDERFHDEDWESGIPSWWVTDKNDDKDKAKVDQGWNTYENGNQWRFNGVENQRGHSWRNNNGSRRRATAQGYENRRESVF